jgi:hypothetical protein
MIGVDQQERNPNCSTTPRKSAHSGSTLASSTMTGAPRHAAVPHEPTFGPITTPSIMRL